MILNGLLVYMLKTFSDVKVIVSIQVEKIIFCDNVFNTLIICYTRGGDKIFISKFIFYVESLCKLEQDSYDRLSQVWKLCLGLTLTLMRLENCLFERHRFATRNGKQIESFIRRR